MMILEAVITTENSDGSPHLSAIGPHVEADLTSWILKPFNSSTTFRNLREHSRCVVHVVDDSLLLAKCVTGNGADLNLDYRPQVGFVLPQACSFFALSLGEWELGEPRSLVHCRVSSTEQLRPFFGWNRAKHALLELAIHATRLDLLDPKFVLEAMTFADQMVAKTGGTSELAALEMLRKFVLERLEQGSGSH